VLAEHQKLAEGLAPFGGAAADLWLAGAHCYAALGEHAQAEALFRATAEANARFKLPWDEAQVAFDWALSLPEPSSQRAELIRHAAALWQRTGASRYAELRTRLARTSV
jgi:hypothetical protein